MTRNARTAVDSYSLPDDGYATSSRFTRHRCTVPLPTPSCAAIVNMPTPAARRSLMAASVALDTRASRSP